MSAESPSHIRAVTLLVPTPIILAVAAPDAVAKAHMVEDINPPPGVRARKGDCEAWTTVVGGVP